MQFIRRPDLDPPTRIHIVRLAWLHQGVYGKMTQIAKSYQISRTFLYQLLLMANLQLETLFSDEKLALHVPILLTIDARSTTILNIELASDRSAETWRAHFDALAEHQFFSLGMASDRGLGFVPSRRSACESSS